MTPDDVKRIQTTWGLVIPIRDQAAALFYGKLFELDPALRPLFKTDLKSQGEKLTDMITVVVNGLTKLDAIVPAVQALGRRHLDYGVKDADYDTVGAALLWTLEQGLGAAFTPEVKGAWAQAYGMLATMMKAAAAAG
jgi:hemoglobin-like flavoprotein